MSKSLNLSTLGPKRIVQMLLGVGGLVLVVGAIVMFLINAQIRDMQATVSSKEALVGTSEQTAQRFQQTQQDYDAIASRAQFLEASVSAKAFVPTLLKQLQTLATTTHLTVTAVRPGLITSPAPPAAPSGTAGGDAGSATAKKVPPPPYDTLDIAVDVVGTYTETASFLYDLTRFPKIISVASVQMHPGGTEAVPAGQASSPIITTNLHLTAFVFHDDVGAGAPAANTLTPTVQAAVSAAPSGIPAAPQPTPAGAVTDAATHAADKALGTGKAAQARREVGIETL